MSECTGGEMHPSTALLLMLFLWPCIVLPIVLLFRVFQVPVGNVHERIGRVVTAFLKGIGYGLLFSILIWAWIVIAFVMLVWFVAQPFGGIEELPRLALIVMGVAFLGGAAVVVVVTPSIRTSILDIVD